MRPSYPTSPPDLFSPVSLIRPHHSPHAHVEGVEARQRQAGHSGMASGQCPECCTQAGTRLKPIGRPASPFRDLSCRQHVRGDVNCKIEKKSLSAAWLPRDLPGFAPQAVNKRREPAEEVEHTMERLVA